MKCSSAPSSPGTSKLILNGELVDLVARAQAGDLQAQSELVRRYTRRITGFVRRIILQRHAVEDVVQNVFIKMIRRLGALRDPRVFEHWLFTLTRNAALDFIRRRRCQPATVNSEFESMAAPDIESAQAVDEIMSALDRALLQLNPKDRQLIRLIVQGNSYQVIAQREGLSVSAVKVRIHRVRPFLRLSVSQAIGTRLRSAKKWRPLSRGCLAA